MSDSGEATINPDGTTSTTTTTTTTEEEPMIMNETTSTIHEENEPNNFNFDPPQDEIPDPTSSSSSTNPKTTDPAIYLALSFIVIVILYVLQYKRQKKKIMDRESFFMDLDGDKFTNIKLPDAVDEFYVVKEKCIGAGWEPGKPATNAQEAANGPVRIMAQALMKRAIQDIPLITLMQKESSSMNKLYSQSMCSIKQWKSYQAAEALISQEVDDVKNEADDIEPGWSRAIWSQAMQYHNMMKNRNAQEMAMKQQALKEAMQKKMEEENKKTPEQIQKEKEEAAEKAARELLEMEEKEEEAKKDKNAKAFKGGMKKGFLDSSSKK